MIRNCLPVVKDVFPTVRPIVKGSPCLNASQIRTTVVVRRKFPVQLAKIGKMPTIRSRNNIYDLEERVHSKPATPIQCILTDYVEGIGGKGDVVSVARNMFRNKLYPLLAIYASPENLADNKKEQEISLLPKTTAFSRKTLEQLSQMYLPIPMSGDTSWTLNQQHVKLALRKVGVEAVEECIELPDISTSQPQELNINITINGVESQKIKAHIYLVFKDPSKNSLEELPKIWHSTRNKSLNDKQETNPSAS